MTTVPPQKPAAPPSVVQSAAASLSTGNRRILVVGARGSGKTTFSMSASRDAGDTIEGPHRLLRDTLVIQGDNEGILGAMDAGLEPAYVVDMCAVGSWQEYTDRMTMALRELKSLLHDGTIRTLVLDLAWPARLIEQTIKPAEPKDWAKVAAEGQRLFAGLSRFRGVTVIGNAQIKNSLVMGEGSRKGAAIGAIETAEARAIGGERSAFTIDLSKGVASVWLDNASFIFARESKRVLDREGNPKAVYSTITRSNGKFEAKSRAHAVLAAREDGNQTMRSLLQRVYDGKRGAKQAE